MKRCARRKKKDKISTLQWEKAIQNNSAKSRKEVQKKVKEKGRRRDKTNGVCFSPSIGCSHYFASDVLVRKPK
jgi:hypothetical protein